MATSADKELKILLKLAADVAESGKLTGALQGIEAQAEKTAAAVRKITVTDANVLPANFDQGNSAQAVALRAQLDARVAAKQAAAELIPIQQASVAIDEAKAQAQAVINAQAERRVILETQLEAAEARIAGNPAMAARLEREVTIRTQALNIQRTLNVTTEESIALSERMVIAQESQSGSTLLTGANLNKAKGEAIVLARELATGSLNARTMGAFLGSLGTSLTIGALAGYELYQVISHAADAALEVAKNNEKIAAELGKAVDEWTKMARAAQSFGDEVKLADKVQLELDKMAVEMAKFRAEQLPLWKTFWDKIGPTAVTIASGLTGFNLPTPVNSQAALDKQKADAQERYNRAVLDANLLLDEAQRKTAEWAAAEANLPQGLADYSQKLSDAEIKLAELDARRQANMKDPSALVAYKEQLGVVEDLRGKVNQLGDEYDKLKKAEDAENRKQQMQAISALLRDHASIISSIREQQQLINANAFLGADAKQALTLASMSAELLQISAAIEETKVAMSNSALDPVTHARLQAELKKDQFEFELLKLKISAVNQPLSAELANWVNNFGTSARQIADLIEGSINATLQGTNQLLLDAAFNTGDWKQTVVGVERQVANLFLTMLEKMALQQAAQLLGITTTTSAQVASGAAITAAHAPAAAATSISSYGAAALIGEIAAIAAIVAIMAALGGGFKRGGYTGDGSADEYAGPAHKGEFYFSKRATRNIGIENLAALHRFGDGGVIEPGILPGNRGRDYVPYYPSWMGPVHGGVGGGPIVDVPRYGDANHIVRSGTTIYPGDDDVVAAPRLVAVDANGLPIGSGGMDDEPSLFPGPQRGGVTITTAGGAPYQGGYAWTPNYLGQFGAGSPFGFFSPWSNLGYGSRPNLSGSPQVSLSGSGIQPNTSRGTWEIYNPSSGVFETVGHFGESIAAVQARAAAIASGISSSGAGRSGEPSGGFAGGAGIGGQSLYTGAMDATTKAFLLGGGYVGRPNQGGDAGRTSFDPSSGYEGAMDPDTGIIQRVRGGYNPWRTLTQAQMAGAPWGVANTAAFNAWVVAREKALGLYHGADGLRLPGPASRADNVLAWLSTGERVIPADRNIALERHFGFDWDRKLDVGLPRLADGGRIGSQASASGQRSGGGKMKLVIVSDLKAAIREAQSEPDFQATIVNAVNGARHELGLPALQ